MSKLNQMWREKAELREGVRYVVYLDSLDLPTGGIGHLLTHEENKEFKVGDRIPDYRVERWFVADSAEAKSHARRQAREIGIEEDWFVLALISVNFQLGGGWTRDFHSTYPAIVNHDFDQAIRNLRRSKWYRQTPVRVEDFIHALERARDFKARPLRKTRTMAGATASGAGIAGAQAIEAVDEIKDQIEPIANYTDTLQMVFVAVAIIGVLVTIYARVSDRKEGHR